MLIPGFKIHIVNSNFIQMYVSLFNRSLVEKAAEINPGYSSPKPAFFSTVRRKGVDWTILCVWAAIKPGCSRTNQAGCRHAGPLSPAFQPPLLLQATRAAPENAAQRGEWSPAHPLWPYSATGGVIAVQITKKQPVLIFPGFGVGWTSLSGIPPAYSTGGAWTECSSLLKVLKRGGLKLVSVLLTCRWLQGCCKLRCWKFSVPNYYGDAPISVQISSPIALTSVSPEGLAVGMCRTSLCAGRGGSDREMTS